MSDTKKKTYYNDIISGASVRDATGRLIHTTLDEALLLDSVVVEAENDEDISSVKNKGSILIVSESVDVEYEAPAETPNPSLTLDMGESSQATSLTYLDEETSPKLTYSDTEVPSISYSSNNTPTPKLTEIYN